MNRSGGLQSDAHQLTDTPTDADAHRITDAPTDADARQLTDTPRLTDLDDAGLPVELDAVDVDLSEPFSDELPADAWAV